MSRLLEPGTRRRVLIAALAVLVALAALLWWRAGGDPPDHTPTGSDPAAATPGEERAPTPPASIDGDAEDAPAAAPIRLVSATVEEVAEDAVGDFEGRVVDFGTGQGVGGAEVTFGIDGATATVVSGADGQFRFEPTKVGTYSLAVVQAEGYLPFAPELGHSPIRLQARRGLRVRGLTVYLTPAIDYRGVVVDPDGAPVAGAVVRLLAAPGGEQKLVGIQERYVAGADGTFVFHAPDFSVFEASHDRFAPGRATLDGRVQVSHELTIRLRPAGARPFGDEVIAGRVVDTAGAPIADAEVAVFDGVGHLTTTDGDGRFEVRGVADGTHPISARHPDHAPASRRVEAGTRDVSIALEPGLVIRGRVVDTAGEVVPAYTVVARRRIDALRQVVVATESVFDAHGEFELRGLPAGEHVLVASASGFAPSEDVDATSAPPGEAEAVEVVLPRGGTVFGRVIDREQRTPLARARVSVEGTIGRGASAVPMVASVVSDEDGTFELSGLAPGRRSLTVAAYRHHSRILSSLEVADGARLGPFEVDLIATKPGEEPKLELAGIGVAIAPADDGLVIQRLIPEGGAAEAGLVVGDVILAVDGRAVTDLGMDGAIQAIRGPEGTAVLLAIRKQDGGAVVDVTAYRRRIRA